MGLGHLLTDRRETPARPPEGWQGGSSMGVGERAHRAGSPPSQQPRPRLVLRVGLPASRDPCPPPCVRSLAGHTLKLGVSGSPSIPHPKPLPGWCLAGALRANGHLLAQRSPTTPGRRLWGEQGHPVKCPEIQRPESRDHEHDCPHPGPTYPDGGWTGALPSLHPHLLPPAPTSCSLPPAL